MKFVINEELAQRIRTQLKAVNSEYLMEYATPLTSVTPDDDEPEPMFFSQLAALINRYSVENRSRTPDFILAEYIGGCLAAWNRATAERERWYGVHLSIGGIVTNVEAPYDGGRQDALWKEIGPDTGDAQPMLPLEVQSDD